MNRFFRRIPVFRCSQTSAFSTSEFQNLSISFSQSLFQVVQHLSRRKAYNITWEAESVWLQGLHKQCPVSRLVQRKISSWNEYALPRWFQWKMTFQHYRIETRFKKCTGNNKLFRSSLASGTELEPASFSLPISNLLHVCLRLQHPARIINDRRNMWNELYITLPYAYVLCSIALFIVVEMQCGLETFVGGGSFLIFSQVPCCCTEICSGAIWFPEHITPVGIHWFCQGSFKNFDMFYFFNIECTCSADLVHVSLKRVGLAATWPFDGLQCWHRHVFGKSCCGELIVLRRKKGLLFAIQERTGTDRKGKWFAQVLVYWKRMEQHWTKLSLCLDTYSKGTPKYKYRMTLRCIIHTLYIYIFKIRILLHISFDIWLWLKM